MRGQLWDSHCLLHTQASARVATETFKVSAFTSTPPFQRVTVADSRNFIRHVYI